MSGRSWQDHGLTWAAVKGAHFNTCLKEILSSMGENGERKIPWDYDRKARNAQALTKIEELGTKDIDKVVWELRIRKELEEEGWTVCYSDGSGLDYKAARAYTRKCFLGLLGTRATHYDGELIGIAQALEEAREIQILAILTDSKPAISTINKLDIGEAQPRSKIEARILGELCRRSSGN